MTAYLLVSAGIFLFLHLAGAEVRDVSDPVFAILADRGQMLLGASLLGVIALLGALALLRQTGLFHLMFSLVKAFSELVRFFLCAVALATCIFWFGAEENLWLEGGPLILSLYIWFYGTVLGLRLFDFNYPVTRPLLAYSALPPLCLGLIKLAAFLN